MMQGTNHKALTDTDTLGGRISLARDASALSLDNAAKMVGVESDVWSAWENDRSEPGREYLETDRRVSAGEREYGFRQGSVSGRDGQVMRRFSKILQGESEHPLYPSLACGPCSMS